MSTPETELERKTAQCERLIAEVERLELVKHELQAKLSAALSRADGLEKERDALLAKERPQDTTPQGLLCRYHNDRVFHELVDQLALTKFMPEPAKHGNESGFLKQQGNVNKERRKSERTRNSR